VEFFDTSRAVYYIDVANSYVNQTLKRFGHTCHLFHSDFGDFFTYFKADRTQTNNFR